MAGIEVRVVHEQFLSKKCYSLLKCASIQMGGGVYAQLCVHGWFIVTRRVDETKCKIHRDKISCLCTLQLFDEANILEQAVFFHAMGVCVCRQR